MKKYIYIKLSLIITLIAGSSLSAQPVVSTTISVEPLAYIVSGHRISLDAAISDARGILDARCYFRTIPDGEFLYVSMGRQEGDLYRCTLPSFGDSVSGIEYSILALNSQKQVIRSSYFHTNNSPEKPLPAWQAETNSDTPLNVFSELNRTGFEGTGIVDARTIIELPVNSDKYGFIVDIYEPEEIPPELNVAHGFFGGFVYETPGRAPRAVKGFAIGLGPFDDKKIDTDTLQPQSQKDTSFPNAEGVPDIGGSDWSGYFETTGEDNRISITAVIKQSNNSVEIITSKSGLAHHLIGQIQSSGHMLLYDQYDGEDWTTHYGPATSTKVAIYDYICPTCSQLNVVSLTRSGNSPPQTPIINPSKKLRYMTPLFDYLIDE